MASAVSPACGVGSLTSAAVTVSAALQPPPISRKGVTCVVGLRRSLAATGVTALVACGFVPSAQAGLVYERGFRTPHPTVWIAHDNGTGAKRLAYGSTPLISPNGRLVLYRSTSPSAEERLMLITAHGGRARVLLSAPLLLAVTWSPDSKRIAVAEQTPATRTSRRRQLIVTIDLATGRICAISRASLPYSLSFSPAGDQLAYTWSASENPLRDDVYRTPATGGRAVRLTYGGHSMTPLWGRNWIVFVRASPGTSAGIPKHNLYLVRPSGSGVHRLTHEPIGKLMFGFTPLAWSSSGERLIAEFEGVGATSYVVTVNPRTGAVRRVGQPTATGEVIRGAALSRDGTTILGVEETAREMESVVTLPYGGGKAHVLARNAVGPSWSR